MNLNINLLTGHYATINGVYVKEIAHIYRRKCEKLSADEDKKKQQQSFRSCLQHKTDDVGHILIRR